MMLATAAAPREVRLHAVRSIHSTEWDSLNASHTTIEKIFLKLQWQSSIWSSLVPSFQCVACWKATWKLSGNGLGMRLEMRWIITHRPSVAASPIPLPLKERWDRLRLLNSPYNYCNKRSYSTIAYDMALIETMHSLTLAKVLQSLYERGMPSRASDLTADDTVRQSCNVLK